MNEERPIILLTNDDGIQSPGLWAAAQAFSGLGEILVVAPRVQQSGTGRSLPITSEGRIYTQEIDIAGERFTAYAVDATPAQAVQHGVLELSNRLPVLAISGINYGENLGSGVTVSGTVGAALEAASMGIPALAISQQTPLDLHLSYSNEVDFSVAAYFARLFGEWLINHGHDLEDVDVLKVDLPLGATRETPWRVTRISRHRVFWPTRPERIDLSEIGRIGYKYGTDPSQAEPDSDLYAVLHDKIISVTPMSLDMTSRTDLPRLNQIMSGEHQYGS